jgi:hypothetical protein
MTSGAIHRLVGHVSNPSPSPLLSRRLEHVAQPRLWLCARDRPHESDHDLASVRSATPGTMNVLRLDVVVDTVGVNEPGGAIWPTEHRSKRRGQTTEHVPGGGEVCTRAPRPTSWVMEKGTDQGSCSSPRRSSLQDDGATLHASETQSAYGRTWRRIMRT